MINCIFNFDKIIPKRYEGFFVATQSCKRKGSKQLEMKNNWNHLCRGMPRRQELDTWRAGQRRTRTCDVTQECEKLNYSDQLTVINEASVQCQDCQGAGLLLAAVPPAWLTKDPLVIFSHHLLRGSAEAVI